MSLETPAREWLSQAAQQEGDVAIAKRLVGVVEPTTEDLVDCARLLLRYDSSRHETNEIRTRLLRAVQFWGITVDELNARCRAIWQSGYRPPGAEVNPNGSGFDSADPDADQPAAVRSSLHRRGKSRRTSSYPCAPTAMLLTLSQAQTSSLVLAA